jgi:hypothetical protein
VVVGDHHVGTLVSERFRDRLFDAGVRTRYDCGFIL